MTLHQQCIRRAMATAVCLALACAAATGDWIIFKDGSAAKVVARKGSVTQVELADGQRREVKSGEVARRLSDRSFDREVDRLMLGLGRKSSRSESMQRLTQLGPAPVDIDALMRATGLDTRALNVVLMELDLAGRIVRHGGGLVSRAR